MACDIIFYFSNDLKVWELRLHPYQFSVLSFLTAEAP